MKLVRICGVALAGVVCTFAGQHALANNLLENPGFETGNFSGWTLSGSMAFEGVSTNFASLPESGRYSAFFGAVGSYNIISQDIATTPGDTYNLTFWLDDSGGPFADAYLNWGSTTALNITPTGRFGWMEFGVDEVATGTSTVVSFGFDQDPSYFNLDDTSVIQVSPGGGFQNSGGYPTVDPPDDSKVPDQGAGLWVTAATLLGLCAAAGYRRRQGRV